MPLLAYQIGLDIIGEGEFSCSHPCKLYLSRLYYQSACLQLFFMNSGQALKFCAIRFENPQQLYRCIKDQRKKNHMRK